MREGWRCRVKGQMGGMELSICHKCVKNKAHFILFVMLMFFGGLSYGDVTKLDEAGAENHPLMQFAHLHGPDKRAERWHHFLEIFQHQANRHLSRTTIALFCLFVVGGVQALRRRPLPRESGNDLNALATCRMSRLSTGWTRVFIVGFLALATFPSWKMSSDDVSIAENRALAKFPAAGKFTLRDASIWCEAFDAAFNDCFFGRTQLMFLRANYLAFWAATRSSLLIHIGRDGWLFAHGDLVNYPNFIQLTDAEKQSIGDYLDKLYQYCRAHGKKFVFLLVPDKSRVYPEYVLHWNKIRPDSEGLGEDLVRFLQTHYDFPVVSSREMLIEHKGESDDWLFFRTDTHWTYYGAYYGGYLPLMQALGREPKTVVWERRPCRFGEFSDLGQRLLRRQPPDQTRYAFPDRPLDMFIRNGTDINAHERESVATLECASGQGQLFCLHDSFLMLAFPYLGREFRSGVACRRGTLRPEDMPAVEKCNVFLFEIVERRLPQLLEAIRADKGGFEEL